MEMKEKEVMSVALIFLQKNLDSLQPGSHYLLKAEKLKKFQVLVQLYIPSHTNVWF